MKSPPPKNTPCKNTREHGRQHGGQHMRPSMQVTTALVSSPNPSMHYVACAPAATGRPSPAVLRRDVASPEGAQATCWRWLLLRGAYCGAITRLWSPARLLAHSNVCVYLCVVHAGDHHARTLCSMLLATPRPCPSRARTNGALCDLPTAAYPWTTNRVGAL